jgi:hypothetical protein
LQFSFSLSGVNAHGAKSPQVTVLSITEYIRGYLPEKEERDMNAWIVGLCAVGETAIENKDFKTRAEYLVLREYNALKAHFQDFDLATF